MLKLLSQKKFAEMAPDDYNVKHNWIKLSQRVAESLLYENIFKVPIDYILSQQLFLRSAYFKAESHSK